MSTSRSSQKDKAETNAPDPGHVGDLLARAADAFPRIWAARQNDRAALLLAVAQALMALARLLTNPRDPAPPAPDAHSSAPAPE